MFARPVVSDAFRAYTVKREGSTPFMYCDILNLVTTGIGNLIDGSKAHSFDISPSAMAAAMSLPWFIKGPGWTKDNPVTAGRASAAQVRDAWIATKLQAQKDPGFNTRSSGFAYTNLTNVTLDADGLSALFSRTFASFDATLAKRFPGYPQAPADAQLCLLSMSWAMGPGFNFPEFKAAYDREDFAAAIKPAFFKGGGPLIEQGGNPATSRNAAHVIMLTNAANVVKAGTDRGLLFFPGTSNQPASNPSGGLLATAPGKLRVAAEALAITGGIGAAAFSIYELVAQRRKRRA